MTTVTDIIGWILTHLRSDGVELNLEKANVVLPGGYGLESLSQNQIRVFGRTRLTVAY